MSIDFSNQWSLRSVNLSDETFSIDECIKSCQILGEEKDARLGKRQNGPNGPDFKTNGW